VNSLHDTWTTFCGAVRAIRPLDIEEQKERQEKQTWMEGELQQVRQQQRQPPSSPSSVLGPAFRNFSVGSIPKPRFQPVATNTQAPQQQYRGPQRMDAKKLSIIACIPRPHPNTANGWAAYQADIAAWIHSNYGQAAHESRPYPLTPGMSPVLITPPPIPTGLQDSSRIPTGFLLDSYWTPGFLLDSSRNPGIQ
jgi:hypothetical protein